MAARLAELANRMLEMKGRESSRENWSEENRFKILPEGVDWKKAGGAQRIPSRSFWWSSREALRAPQAKEKALERVEMEFTRPRALRAIWGGLGGNKGFKEG